MGKQPGRQRAVGLDVPEVVLRQPEEDAVHEEMAHVIAGDGIAATALLRRGDAACEDMFEEPLRIRT